MIIFVVAFVFRAAYLAVVVVVVVVVVVIAIHVVVIVVAIVRNISVLYHSHLIFRKE